MSSSADPFPLLGSCAVGVRVAEKVELVVVPDPAGRETVLFAVVRVEASARLDSRPAQGPALSPWRTHLCRGIPQAQQR